jgi:hypothetical protein
MRSGLIFRASDHISNRFLLCRMLAASARKMHRDGVSTSQSINESLVALHGVQKDSTIEKSNVTAEALNADGAKAEGNHAEAAQGGS